MKSFLVGWLLVISMGILSLYKLKWHPFIKNDTPHTIILRYKDLEEQIEIEPYTTLETLLRDRDLPQDVDVKALNPLITLTHGDVVDLPIKIELPCISINTAPLEMLTTLNGIGPSIGQRILDYRQANGLFQTIEELKQVKGIGPKIFEAIKDRLCI